MSRNKEELARREGMSYALKVAKEKGIDGLEAELKRRSAYNIPIGIPDKALDEFITNVKNCTLDTVLILACVTLHDEYGFGQQRIQRFLDRFDDKADCLANPDWTTWQDQIDILADECDIHLSIRENNKNVKI